MVPYIVNVVSLLLNPLLGFWCNGSGSGLLIFLLSFTVLYTIRKNVYRNRKIIYAFNALNHILLIYCAYYTEGRITIKIPESHIFIPENELIRAEPFVSIVLVDGLNSSSCVNYQATVTALVRTATPVLTREIVLPYVNESLSRSNPLLVSSLSEDSDMVIFVSCGVELMDNWMNGIVREIFSHSDQMIVPTLHITPRTPLTAGAMIASRSGMWFEINPRETEHDVPLIPRFSVLGMSRALVTTLKFSSILNLLSDNRILELSLTAWFCHGGIRSSGFSKVLLREKSIPPHDWKGIEGDTVDEKVVASCNSSREMEWFYEKFAQYDPEAYIKVFEIQVGLRNNDGSRTCLMAHLNGTLGIARCDRENMQLMFVIPPHAPAIKSVGIPGKCLDTNSVHSVGSNPILYTCTERNRNQMFYFDGIQIRWGSFCLGKSERGEFTLEMCTDSETQVFYAEYY
jgi:hypothetical protein